MNNNNIEKLHDKLLLIMNEIKRICDENNLKYFLDGGTCLGAIRHKGFIPWDDDADIAMPRDDYEAFKKICIQGGMRNPFFFHDYETDKHYVDGFCRIRLNNTLFAIPYHKKRKYCHLGVFVDIFPFDYTYTNDRKKLEKNRKRILFINRVFENKKSSFKELPTFKSKCFHLLSTCFSDRFLLSQRKKREAMFDKKTRMYVFSAYTSYDVMKKVIPYSFFEKTIEVQFEKTTFRVPVEYDLFLTQLFGNYMELPPIEKRIGHLPDEVDF